MEKGSGSPKVERRGAPRVRLLTRACFYAEDVEGEGTVFDLSVSGARVENASHRLQPGAETRLILALSDDDAPLEASGKVVRETETGFAVCFNQVDERLEAWFRRILCGPGAPRPAPKSSDDPGSRR